MMPRIRSTILLFCAVLLTISLHAANRPNILFCIADDASPDFGAYGCTWVKTPSFDRIASEGVLFTRAYTPNAKCAPSRAIILTGRHSWQLEAAANHWCFFPEKYTGWMEALLANGYNTGSTGKGWAPGKAPGRNLTGKKWSKRRLKPPASGISSVDYAGNFKEFLDAGDAEKPWAFWYGAGEPHRGYEFQSGVNKNGRALSDIPTVPSYWPDNNTIRHDMLDYGMEVEHYDTHIGLMLAELEKRGALENTLIIATSDHGRPAPRQKGQAYHQSNHVPFAVMWKNGIHHPGRTVEDFIDFTDLAPTLLEVAGVSREQAAMQRFAGRSLLPLLTSARSGHIDPLRDHVLLGKERHDIGRPQDGGYPIRAMIREDFMYIQNFEPTRWPAGNPETGYLNCDGGPTKTEILNLWRSGANTTFWELCFGKRPSKELYHLTEDPECVNSLANTPAFTEKKKEMESALHSMLKAQGDPRIQGQGHLFDEYPYANTPQKGFYEKFRAGTAPPTGWVKASDYEKEPDQE